MPHLVHLTLNDPLPPLVGRTMVASLTGAQLTVPDPEAGEDPAAYHRRCVTALTTALQAVHPGVTRAAWYTTARRGWVYVHGQEVARLDSTPGPAASAAVPTPRPTVDDVYALAATLGGTTRGVPALT